MTTELAVSKLLDSYRVQFESALPRHMRIDHFMRCALTYVKKNPGVAKCTPVSICKALMDAAQLGLAPDGLLGSAYLVPFNNKVRGADGSDTWENTCQLIPGYRGLIDLARRSGEILDIQARPVLKGEDFEIDWGRQQPLSHKPNLDANPAEDNGANVRGIYAIAFYKDGSQHLEYMSRAEIEGIQRRSKANGKGFSPWQTDWVEMGRKTLVKRLSKYLPLSPELARAIELDNEASEVVRPVEVTEAPALTATAGIKNRLTQQLQRPLAEDLAAAPAPEAHADPEPAPAAEPTPAPAVEPDVLTRGDKLFVRMLGSKRVMAKVADMNETDLRDARDAAEATLHDPAASDADRSRAAGVIVLLEDEAARRVKA